MGLLSERDFNLVYHFNAEERHDKQIYIYVP